MKELYPNFLENKDDYFRCEDLWNKFFYKTLFKEGDIVNHDWEPWQGKKNRYVDGTLMKDALLFQTISPSRKIGIREYNRKVIKKPA